MNRTSIVVIVSLLACAGCRATGTPGAHAGEPGAHADTYPSGAPRHPDDNVELARVYAEDQADRDVPPGTAIDWSKISPRDKAREGRIQALYRAGELHTAADFHHAAMVLQHASEPDDYLLAHEMCIVAISKGDASALWLCAASEDRFLDHIGRQQRFATQYKQDRLTDPFRLAPVSDGVTDGLRAQFHAPSLEEARKMEQVINTPAH